MAKRHQNSAHDSLDSDDAETRQRAVEELIAKGREKEAFKLAKLHFHREASPENRQLVERTYLVRIQALIRGGMLSAGSEVALSLLEFGLKDPGVTEEVILLLPRLGLGHVALTLQTQSQSPEVQARLLIKLADRAVLHPEETPASLPELRETANRVRSALAALDSDNEAQALELLQPIPRSSPLADWRYFVRGLIAFRHDDLEQAKSNWERLDPQRSARKIARTLLPDEKLVAAEPAHLKALESLTFGGPVLERLTDLRHALEAADWRRALQVIGPLRHGLHRIDPRYSQRLTEIVLFPLSAEIMQGSYREAERLLKDVKAALEPLPWDPQWNRLEALLWEGPQGDAHGAVDHWRMYLKDLDKGVPGLPGELRQVQALVWRRIGSLSRDLESDEEEFGPFQIAPRGRPKAPNDVRTQVVEALQQSLLLDPKQRRTYELLIESYTEWEQPERLIATLEELLKAFPDDVEALRQLLHQRRLRDEPELVLNCVARLRALRPLDPRLPREEAWGRLALARHLALAKRWEEGRAEFAHLEKSLKEHVPPFRLLSRRAALEFKAGDAALAEKYISEALATLKEPTPLWLALAIEAVRYQLPKPLQVRFNLTFRKAIAGKVTSETAGELAETLAGYIVGRIDYAGRDGHVEEVVGYLRRTSRLKYQEPELRHVCQFLQIVGNKEAKLLTTLVKRGLKLFPASPIYLMLEAELDLMKGPAAFRPKPTRKKLEKALALAEASQNPEDAGLIPMIKQALARVQDIAEAMESLPFMGGGMPGMPPGMPGMPGMPPGMGIPGMPGTFRDFLDLLASRFEDMDSDFDDDDDEPRPSRAKRPPKPKRK